MPSPANIQFPYSEYPDVIPGDFQKFISLGKKSVTVELFGIAWSMTTLEEWEERLVEKKLDGLDVGTKNKLRPIEILTHAINSCAVLDTTKTWDFSTEDKKQILRSVLLIESPITRHYLFRAYQVLVDVTIEEFAKKYPDLEKQLMNDIRGILTPKTSSPPVEEKSETTELAPENTTS